MHSLGPTHEDTLPLRFYLSLSHSFWFLRPFILKYDVITTKYGTPSSLSLRLGATAPATALRGLTFVDQRRQRACLIWSYDAFDFIIAVPNIYQQQLECIICSIQFLKLLMILKFWNHDIILHTDARIKMDTPMVLCPVSNLIEVAA